MRSAVCGGRMDKLNCSQMFLPCWIRTSSTCKITCNIVDLLRGCAEWHWSSDCIDDRTNFLLSSTSTFRAFAFRSCLSNRTFASFPSVWTIMIVASLVVSLSRTFSGIMITLGWPGCSNGSLHKLAEMTGLDKFFNFIFQCLASFGRMAVVTMVLATFTCIGIGGSLRLLQCRNQFNL